MLSSDRERPLTMEEAINNTMVFTDNKKPLAMKFAHCFVEELRREGVLKPGERGSLTPSAA